MVRLLLRLLVVWWSPQGLPCEQMSLYLVQRTHHIRLMAVQYQALGCPLARLHYRCSLTCGLYHPATYCFSWRYLSKFWGDYSPLLQVDVFSWLLRSKLPVVVDKHHDLILDVYEHVGLSIIVHIFERKSDRRYVLVVAYPGWPKKNTGVCCVSAWKLDDFYTAVEI